MCVNVYWFSFDERSTSPKPDIEILLVVLTLIRNVRRVVHDNIENLIPEGHGRVISDYIRLLENLDVEA